MSELKVGKAAPAFTMESSDGSKVSLKDLKGKKVVLYFYPKDLTPGCTKESCDFRDLKTEIAKAGAVIFGVSKDSIDSHGKFIAKEKLNFPLLSDPDGRVCEKYGVWQEKSNYGKKYMGIVRTTFIIDEDGKIAKIYPNVKVDGHANKVLEDLKSI